MARRVVLIPISVAPLCRADEQSGAELVPQQPTHARQLPELRLEFESRLEIAPVVVLQLHLPQLGALQQTPEVRAGILFFPAAHLRDFEFPDEVADVDDAVLQVVGVVADDEVGEIPGGDAEGVVGVEDRACFRCDLRVRDGAPLVQQVDVLGDGGVGGAVNDVSRIVVDDDGRRGDEELGVDLVADLAWEGGEGRESGARLAESSRHWMGMRRWCGGERYGVVFYC